MCWVQELEAQTAELTAASDSIARLAQRLQEQELLGSPAPSHVSRGDLAEAAEHVRTSQAASTAVRCLPAFPGYSACTPDSPDLLANQHSLSCRSGAHMRHDCCSPASWICWEFPQVPSCIGRPMRACMLVQHSCCARCPCFGENCLYLRAQ